MLNRYGLVDIVKLLREQEEEPPPPGGDPAAGGAPPEGEAPPPPEDPDEKIDQAREKNQAADLEHFREKHSDVIFKIANTHDPDWENFARNAALRSLHQRYEEAGLDIPFFTVFDPQTTGLRGRRHLSLIASMHHAGKLSKGKVYFHSAGDATSFAKHAGNIRDDLTFEVDDRDTSAVSYKKAEEEQPPEEAPAPQPPPMTQPMVPPPGQPSMGPPPGP